MTRRRRIACTLFMLISLLRESLSGQTQLPMPSEQQRAGAPAHAAESRPRHTTAAQCGSCHPRHFQEWSESSHARSVTSADFQRGLTQYLAGLAGEGQDRREAAMACFSCHAPVLRGGHPALVEQIAALVTTGGNKELQGFEVGCTACHLDNSGPSAEAAHDRAHAANLPARGKGAGLCADCHSWTPPGVFCSDVYTDWRQSRAAKQGVTCRHCHMAEQFGTAFAGAPAGKVHDHTFPGSRSAGMLRSALSLRLQSAFRRNALEVIVTVRNRTPHRVPDG